LLKIRIIPCLDVDAGRVVKGINFLSLRDAGDPVEQAKAYSDEGADEITFLDITATHQKRSPMIDVISKTAEKCFVPLTVGGGVKNIIGIKEAVDSEERIKTLIELCGNDFLIISGDDPTAMHTILSGGKGVITVTGNIMPMEMHMMCKAALEGDEAKAREFNEKMSSFYELLFIESNPIPVKYVLYKMGLIQDGIRLPLTWLSKEKQKYVDKAIREAKLI